MSADRYAIESLAATGFAVLDGPIAATLRPDLWRGGMEARADLARAASKSTIGSLRGVHKFLARLDGRAELVPVIARSDVDLARRISLVVGMRCARVFRESDLAGEPMEMPEVDTPRRSASRGPRGDLWAGVATKEPGRTCSECAHFTAGHSCRSADTSGIQNPAPNTIRRCAPFKPRWDAIDGRDGATLWPELAKRKRPVAAAQE